MKYVKMLGLATVAAVALMAVGASTASATVICSTVPSEGVCPKGWTYPAGTVGLGTQSPGTTITFQSTAGVVLDTCTGWSMEGKSVNTGSATETVKGELVSVNTGTCSRTTDVLNIGSGEVHWIPGTNNGTVTATESTEYTILTIFGTCVYGTGAALDMGTAIGGNPGKFVMNAVIPKTSGNFACPSHGVLTGEGVPTSPTAGWVAKE